MAQPSDPQTQPVHTEIGSSSAETGSREAILCLSGGCAMLMFPGICDYRRVILILMKFRILILACCHVVPNASLVSKLFLFSL